MAKQGRDTTVFTLTVLTAAIGAGTAGEANAQVVSTKPVGFVPIVFSTALPSMTQGFDVDKNGIVDFNIANAATRIDLDPLGASNSYSAFAGQITKYDNTSSFSPVTSLKTNSADTIGNGNLTSLSSNSSFSNFNSGVAQFVEVGTNLSYDAQGAITGGQLGYFSVTRNTMGSGGTDGGQVETFTIDDYGLVGGLVGAAPEPSTWLLLTLGFGVVGGTMRRRRRVAGNTLALAA